LQQPSPYRIAIAATFTADPIALPLAFWSGPLSTPLETAFAPFDQVLQSLLDPSSVLRTNGHGLNVVLFRHEDLGESTRRGENLKALAGALAAVPAGPAPYLVIACAESDVHESTVLRQVADSKGHVTFLEATWIAERYPVKRTFSPDGEKLGGIPYTEDYFIALAATVVRVAHALQHPPAKVLALDCDNTLWQGICGEDGPEGVRLTPGHAALQRFAVEQRAQGMLLVLASKNNWNDVEATFAAHPEFPLRLEHITAHRVNWAPKPGNLEALAKELSLGLDSFVFLDDSRKEVSEVARELPQVVSIEVPHAGDELAQFTKHLWVCDRLRLTETDRQRAESYARTQEFGKALAQAQSLADFYDNLELQVQVRGVEAADFARASQLTQRTNQFNLTTIRRSEADLHRLWDERAELFRIDVRDRFGEYGFTGLLIGKAAHGCYAVDTFLLSCRVLGRGVEHAVMRWLGAHASRLGLREVELPFSATAKNQPAAAFLKELGAISLPFRATAEELARAQLSADAPAAPAVEANAAPKAEARRSLDYALLATQLASVERLKLAMRPDSVAPVGIFATGTETRLARLWQELLPAAQVEASSNFFELGGHSLLAVLLLTKISESFGVELGIDEAYSIDMTLERMARRIDEAQAFANLDRREYQLLFAEIARLSDAEVREALERETTTSDAHSLGL
jgi:FkbH-like protein